MPNKPLASTLDELIATFETSYPTYNWLVRKIDPPSKTKTKWYLASAVPLGYVASIKGPNPAIVKTEAKSPEEALTTILHLLGNRT